MQTRKSMLSMVEDSYSVINWSNLEKSPIAIGITGGSGSGKTTFTRMLQDYLRPHAVALSHDDYYKHLPDMTAEEAASYDFDSPESLDTHLLVNHLEMLKRGLAVEVPSYDFATHARSSTTRHVDPAPVILVEGLLIMCIPELRNMLDFIVFIDTDADVRALRRVKRDCLERGADIQRALDMYFGFSKPAYHKYVEPLKGDADIILSDAADEQSLHTIARAIAQLM